MSNVYMKADSIQIAGEAKVLLCASLFYFRIPHEDWEARMLQLRTAGYNCIDVYFPWNFHETSPGKWNFQGMRDPSAFLKLAAENGLYVIARPGPYICSEWDGGGLPIWLNTMNMQLRQNDELYLSKLTTWLERILPIIASYEFGKGGSVIAVQLENELDFYRCKMPHEYMEKLRDAAKRCRITVPLIACAGECDLQGAYGETQGVHPTFNAYSRDDYPHLEPHLAHMRILAAERGTPLIITETDRKHAKLKRELMCAARIISPYNQVGGTNIDMTNGISNWSGDSQRPLSIMATDYDFDSMITVDGRFREETVQARLLSSMIDCLGEHLATAMPCDKPVSLACDFPTALNFSDEGCDEPYFPCLKMDCGWLIGASNLGKTDGIIRLTSRNNEVSISIKAGEAKIFPWHVSLIPWGRNAELVWSTAEILSITTDRDTLKLTLVGSKSAAALVQTGGQSTLVKGKSWTDAGAGVAVRILPVEEAVFECPSLRPLTVNIPSTINKVAVDTLRRYNFCLNDHTHYIGDGIMAMEEAGNYRGDVFYEFSVSDTSPIMLKNPADMMWRYCGDTCVADFCDGSNRMINGMEGFWRIRLQSWGHSNFDDMRQPALQMGSLKGVADIVRMTSKQDITDLWYIYPDEKYITQEKSALRGTDRILATDINTWNYPACPFEADYERNVFLKSDCDRFYLEIKHANTQISAWIDDAFAGSFRAADDYLDITSAVKHNGCVKLKLRVVRRFSSDSLGRITLWGGVAIKNARMYGVSSEQWAAITPTGDSQLVQLPLELYAGQECIMDDILPKQSTPKSRMLVLEGSGIEATLIANGYVCGRIQTPTDEYPAVSGGAADRIYLPVGWTNGSVYLHLCGIGNGGAITSIYWEEIVS